MLKKGQRLPIKTFPKTASRIANPYFSLKFTPNHLGRNRFGVIIGTKTEKSSVKRHKIKRRAFALLGMWPNIETDILLIAGTKTKELKTSSALKRELDEAIKGIISRKRI